MEKPECRLTVVTQWICLFEKAFLIRWRGKHCGVWDERDVVVSKGGISTVFAGGAFFKLVLLRRCYIIGFILIACLKATQDVF